MHILEALNAIGAVRRDEMFGRDGYGEMNLWLKFTERDPLHGADVDFLNSCKKVEYAVRGDLIDIFYAVRGDII